ncbi:hypothetical protein Tco_1421368 [Tanacetum coccineum]
MTMDWYTKNTLWLYWKRGDDEDVLTDDELSNLEEEDLSKDNEIVELEEYWWGKKEEEESSEDDWSNYLPNDEWEHYEDTAYEKSDVNSNHNTYNNVCQIFKNRARINDDNDAIQANQEWFDNHEPMEDDDDDIGDLDDYLIPNDAPYYVDEEEERFKEKKSKLHGIPYEKPPMFKSKKFEVIKYSLAPMKEYVAIKEYEYDIWV